MWREAFAQAKSQNTLSWVRISRAFVRRPCGGVHCIIIGNKTQFYSPPADNAHYIIYIVFILRLNRISHEYKFSSGFQRASERREKKVNSFASRSERRKRHRGIRYETGGKENRKSKRENSVFYNGNITTPADGVRKTTTSQLHSAVIRLTANLQDFQQNTRTGWYRIILYARYGKFIIVLFSSAPP